MRKLRLILCFLAINTILFPQIQLSIDSLEAVLPDKKGMVRSEVLMQLSGLYQNISLEKSLEYDLENVILQRSLGSKKNLSGTLNNIGVSYYLMGDYGISLDYFEQSLILREQFHDTVNIVKTLNNLGVISQITGDFQKALEYLKRSLIFKLDMSDTLSIAKTLNNIGVLYKDVQEYEDAESFLSQALDYYLTLNNQSGIAAAYNNLGQVFEARDNMDSAMVYFEKSLEIKRQIKDDRGIANTLNNIGMIYLAKRNDERAEVYLDEAAKIREKIGDNFGLASTLNNLGNLYYGQKKYQRAKNSFLASKQIAIDENLMGIQKRNYAGLSKLYESMGDDALALHFYKKYSVAQDSTFNIELKDQIASLKVQYETEKSRRENNILQQRNEIQALKIENANNERTQFITVIVALFFVSLLIVIFLQYRNHRNLNRQLHQHNLDLEMRVKERTHKLEEANASKDRFFSIIAHDLKSPFNGLLGFANLLYDDFDALSEQKKKEFSGFIKESASNIYKLVENLLEWSSSQTGSLRLVAEKLDLPKLISETILASKLVAESKRIKVHQNIQSQNFAFADEDTLRVVLRNLFSNALKFTPKGGRVEFVVEDYLKAEGESEIIVQVKDNGLGISQEDLGSLFSLQRKFTTKGTEKEIGTGLGLILCKDFIEKNGGQLFVESEPGKGSIFSFTLPCDKSKI